MKKFPSIFLHKEPLKTAAADRHPQPQFLYGNILLDKTQCSYILPSKGRPKNLSMELKIHESTRASHDEIDDAEFFSDSDDITSEEADDGSDTELDNEEKLDDEDEEDEKDDEL